MDNYIEENRGFITSSKLKTYLDNKEAYKKIYIDEIDTEGLVPESKALERWQMVDQFILSPEEFEENYAFKPGKGYKADLVKACNERGIPTKGDTVKDLEAKLYGNKTVITPGDEEMLFGIKRELKRQPIFDWDGEYDHQKELIAEYQWLKLRSKLDRFSEEKKLIRDLKTTKDMSYSSYNECSWFEDQLIHNDKYRYWFQLAFYWVQVKVRYWVECDGIIDAIQPTGNYAFESYRYSSKTLKSIAGMFIFPALDQLIEDTKNNDFTPTGERGKLLDSRYYPFLDSAVQKEYREISPTFY